MGTDKPYEKLVRLGDILPDLQEISRQIEECQDKIEKAERNEDISSHMQAGMALSSLEIYMSNFAVMLRERFRV